MMNFEKIKRGLGVATVAAGMVAGLLTMGYKVFQDAQSEAQKRRVANNVCVSFEENGRVVLAAVGRLAPAVVAALQPHLSHANLVAELRTPGLTADRKMEVWRELQEAAITSIIASLTMRQVLVEALTIQMNLVAADLQYLDMAPAPLEPRDWEGAVPEAGSEAREILKGDCDFAYKRESEARAAAQSAFLRSATSLLTGAVVAEVVSRSRMIAKDLTDAGVESGTFGLRSPISVEFFREVCLAGMGGMGGDSNQFSAIREATLSAFPGTKATDLFKIPEVTTDSMVEAKRVAMEAMLEEATAGFNEEQEEPEATAPVETSLVIPDTPTTVTSSQEAGDLPLGSDSEVSEDALNEQEMLLLQGAAPGKDSSGGYGIGAVPKSKSDEEDPRSGDSNALPLTVKRSTALFGQFYGVFCDLLDFWRFQDLQAQGVATHKEEYLRDVAETAVEHFKTIGVLAGNSPKPTASVVPVILRKWEDVFSPENLSVAASHPHMARVAASAFSITPSSK